MALACPYRAYNKWLLQDAYHRALTCVSAAAGRSGCHSLHAYQSLAQVWRHTYLYWPAALLPFACFMIDHSDLASLLPAAAYLVVRPKAQ